MTIKELKDKEQAQAELHRKKALILESLEAVARDQPELLAQLLAELGGVPAPTPTLDPAPAPVPAPVPVPVPLPAPQTKSVRAYRRPHMGSQRALLCYLHTGGAKQTELDRVMKWGAHLSSSVISKAITTGLVVRGDDRLLRLTPKGEEMAAWFLEPANRTKVLYQPAGPGRWRRRLVADPFSEAEAEAVTGVVRP